MRTISAEPGVRGHTDHAGGPAEAGGHPPLAAWGRRETELERVDRNLLELVQELRVVQTGVQVLFGFLLTVPFTSRFPDTTPFQRDLYFTALMLAGLSAVLLIAPCSLHRLVFRCGDKERVLQISNRYAIAGLVSVAATMTVSVALVADLLYGAAGSVIVGACTGAAVTLTWFVLPMRRRRTLSRAHDEPRDAPATLVVD